MPLYKSLTLGALLQDGVNASGITMGGVSGTNPRNVSLANNNNLAIVSSNQPDNISITNISSDNPFFVAFMASEQFKNYNASQFGDLDYNGAKRYDYKNYNNGFSLLIPSKTLQDTSLVVNVIKKSNSTLSNNLYMFQSLVIVNNTNSNSGYSVYQTIGVKLFSVGAKFSGGNTFSYTTGKDDMGYWSHVWDCVSDAYTDCCNGILCCIAASFPLSGLIVGWTLGCMIKYADLLPGATGVSLTNDKNLYLRSV